MLECRACALRCIRAIAGDALLTQRPLILTPQIKTAHPRRLLGTTRQSSSRRHSPSRGQAPARRQPSNRTRPAAAKEHFIHRNERFEDYEFSPEGSQEHLPATTADFNPSSNASSGSLHQSTTSTGVAKSNEKALRKELVWLKDPLKFAQHVHYVLRNDEDQKALDLCRLASKDKNVVVAWNHLINWHMQRRRVNKAIEIYNEMKKRGQFPDSYTYMMILRGWDMKEMSRNPEDLHNFMLKAVNIYHSMSGPTSRVKPGIMHTNAMLRLCSLAHDMDAMWGIASKIPDSGPGSADHVTYSILLSAIRFGAFGSSSGGKDWANDQVSVDQISPKKQQAVDEGRRIWQEVIVRWRKGEIQIDEEMVTEMARLLLFGGNLRDWDNVLDLVQQTMRIERQIPELESPDRHTAHVPVSNAPNLPTEDEDGWVPTPAADAFKPFSSETTDVSKRASSIAWVSPGVRTLMVLISACTQMRTPKAAKAYWDILVSEHDVKPDLGAYKQMMRLLRINRNARGAVQLLSQTFEVDDVVYILAMSCCIRNWKDPKILDSATEIIDHMEQHFERPEVRVLNDFLALALKTEDATKIIPALKRVDKMVEFWHTKATMNASKAPSGDGSRDQDDAVSFFKWMIASIDTLRKLISPEDFQQWNARRSQINSYLGLAVNSREARRAKSGEYKPAHFDRMKQNRAALYDRAKGDREATENPRETAGDGWRKLHWEKKHSKPDLLQIEPPRGQSRPRGRRNSA